MKTFAFLAFVGLVGPLLGCGCKRPSIVADPEIVSYTLTAVSPDVAESVRRTRGIATAPVAAQMRAIDELLAVQEALERGTRADVSGFFARQLCPLVGGRPDCVTAVRRIAPRVAAQSRRQAAPEQYMVCLKDRVRLSNSSKASAFLPRAFGAVGDPLKPNVLWRLEDPRPATPPSAEEKLATIASRAHADWALKQIDYAGSLETLRRRRPGEAPGQGSIVVQLDTGVTNNCQLRLQPGKPELVVAIDKGFDYFTCKDEPLDVLDAPSLPLEARQPGHGTGTSTVLASPHQPTDCTPPELDVNHVPTDHVVGIAPGATVIPVKVTDGIILGFPAASKFIMEWQGVSFDARVRALIAGVYHAIERDASVISISMGGICADDEVQKRNNEELRRWLAEAEANGIIIVAAAGQFPVPGFVRRLFMEGYPVCFPGSFPSTIATAASSIFGVPWTQSSRGAKVDITAPGFGVWRGKPKLNTSTPEDEIDVGEGTSFAAAITAGTAALWVQYWGKQWLRDRYGPATNAAFRFAVRAAAQQPSDLAARLQAEAYGGEIRRHVAPWKTSEFGAGLLNANRLLQVDLTTLSKSDVCRAERARLGKEHDVDWESHYQQVCG